MDQNDPTWVVADELPELIPVFIHFRGHSVVTSWAHDGSAAGSWGQNQIGAVLPAKVPQRNGSSNLDQCPGETIRGRHRHPA